MKKILFLSIATSEDVRDKLTYNFISKEMNALANKGLSIVHFHPFAKPQTKNNIAFDGSEQLKRVSATQALLFMIKNITNYAPLLLKNARHAVWLAKLEIAIGQVIEKYDIDVVHAHFMAPYGLCAVNVCKAKNIPIVSTLRGAELYDEPKLSYGAMASPMYKKAIKVASKHINLVTAPNKEMQKLAIEFFDMPSANVIYLPNGVEDELLAQEPSINKAPKAPIKLIAIGRLIYRKNYQRLLDVIDKLDRDMVELTLVGDGPLKQQLQSYVHDKKLRNVKIVNEIPKQQLYDMISMSDYLVHPSYIEGLPNVVIEALAHGKPVILSKIGAHEDLIKEGESGFYFSPEDNDTLLKILKKVIAEPNLAVEMANNSYSQAQHFKLSSKINRYCEIYQALAGNKN